MVRWAGLALLFCLAPLVQAASARELSRTPDPDDFPQSRRRLQRHHRPHRRSENVHHPRHTDHRRQSRRRRRQDRRGSRSACTAGWLHAAGGLGFHAFLRAGGHRQAELRSDQGLRADLADCAGAEPAGGESEASGDDGPGAGRAGKSAARKAQLRLRRARIDQPLRGRDVHRAGRHPERHRPCAVSRRRSRDDRDHRRRHPILLQPDRRHGAVRRGRIGPAAWR